ncbi:MAG: hypothetical protein OER80_02970 [Gammaproteobacteria bacterium]|nr:hypothetical protein [Gammaproteobacteria bacterium]MDH3766901.1 hypothetical protein [Gammaproteobacteria bacterium]
MNQPSKLRLSLATLAAVYSGVVSCADQQSTEKHSTEPLPKRVDSQPMPEAQQPMNTDSQVSTARQDLAQRLGVEVDTIEIDSVRHVNWRSGATGCPKPGMSYTMSIVAGILIVLRADGEEYRYHGRRNGTPFYCPTNRAELPVYGQGGEVM